MNLTGKTTKEIGNFGEETAAQYLLRGGFRIIERNIARKTGEIDIIAKKGETLHFVEVKSVLRHELPSSNSARDEYYPTVNLHEGKIKKIARTAEWYVAETDWEGEWQVDGLLVWLRERDGASYIEYLPQIV